jgi:hypothetical protein
MNTSSKINPGFVFQTLIDFVNRCLERGDELQISSIAFPALGTGFLHFPANIVVRRLLQCVKDFEMTHKSTSLTDVRFIVFPKDTTTFDEFESEFNRYSYTIFHKPRPKGTSCFTVFNYFVFLYTCTTV